MMRKWIIASWLCLGCVTLAATLAAAPAAVRDSVEYAGQTRYHYIFMPDSLRPEKPLVIMLHGYGGHAEGYRPEMLEVAQREGFALCVPQGLKAPQGKSGWFVGYPKQEGMRQDDDVFICALADSVCSRHSLNPCNVFLTGMSNGGEMCYLIGRRYPRSFSAIASIAGLTMKWIRDEVPVTAPVPFMEVHGTADKTSLWDGDLGGEGGWGAYIPVPEAVSYWVEADGYKEFSMQELKSKSERSVILHRWSGGVPAWSGGPECEVRLYEIRGGKHSWGLSDMDTCEEVWRFFENYLRSPFCK